LIPLEREKTDRHLLTERAIWDGAVANRDDFLGIVSHDLRGLLGGIVSAAALLSMKAPDTPTADMPPRRRSGSGGMPLP
jgi:signal transduction histidine kinase